MTNYPIFITKIHIVIAESNSCSSDFLTFQEKEKNFITFARRYQYLRNSDSILFNDIQIHCYSYSNLTDENSYHRPPSKTYKTYNNL